jgi:hypothetical protein
VHIQVLEAIASFQTLKLLAQKIPLQGKEILLLTDNTASAYTIAKEGRSRSPELSLVVRQFLTWMRSKGAHLHVEHIPGLLNTTAVSAVSYASASLNTPLTLWTPAPGYALTIHQDFDSRLQYDTHGWQLNPQVFLALETIWGPHNIDLFASALNRQIPTFCSWGPDPEAFATNAFTIHWGKPWNAFINAPWSLLPRIIRKILTDRAQVTLITPWWPTQVWWPILLQLAIDPPRLLPNLKHLVLYPQQLSSQGRPMSRPPQAQMLAWRLGSDDGQMQVFRASLPKHLPDMGKTYQSQTPLVASTTYNELHRQTVWMPIKRLFLAGSSTTTTAWNASNLV